MAGLFGDTQAAQHAEQQKKAAYARELEAQMEAVKRRKAQEKQKLEEEDRRLERQIAESKASDQARQQAPTGTRGGAPPSQSPFAQGPPQVALGGAGQHQVCGDGCIERKDMD